MNYFLWVEVTCLIIAVAILGFGGYNTHQQETNRHVVADELGCKYIGSARDLHGVAFYNCNGEVKMKLDQ